MAVVSGPAQAISILATVMYATAFILYMVSTLGLQKQAFYSGTFPELQLTAQLAQDTHFLGAFKWCDDYGILGGINSCNYIALDCTFYMTNAAFVSGPGLSVLPLCMEFNAWRAMVLISTILTFFSMVFAAMGFCSPLRGPKIVTIWMGIGAFVCGMIQFSLFLDYKNNQFDRYVQQVIFMFLTTASVPHIQSTLYTSFVMQTFAWGLTALATLTHYLLLCSCIVPLMKIKTHMTSTEEMYTNFYTKNPAAEMSELNY